MRPLTEKQRSVLEYVIKICVSEYRSPTVRELCDVFGHSSTNGMCDIIRALRSKEYIKSDRLGLSNSINISDKTIREYRIDNEANSLKLKLLMVRQFCIASELDTEEMRNLKQDILSVIGG